MPHEEFKVIIVGDSGVGKTSFVVRFADCKFLNVHEVTVGVDCKKVILDIQGTTAELHLWDTAGQERFKSIVNRFYRSANGAIVMYDVTKQSTFDSVSWWVKEVTRYCPNIPIFLVGNKNDDARRTEVLEEIAQDFAESNTLYFYQTSARDNINVTEVFKNLATAMIMERQYRATEASAFIARNSATERNSNLNLHSPPENKIPCCSSYYSKGNQSLII